MKKENFLWNSIKTGMLGGSIALFICLIGMTEVFSKRDVIEKVITLGQFVLLATSVMTGLIASRQTSQLVGENRSLHRLTAGLVAGLMTGVVLALFVLAGDKVNIRAVFLNATPGLYNILTFEKGVSGVWVLPVISAVSGLIGAAFLLLPQAAQKPLTQATLFLFFMALFSGLFRVVLINQGTNWEKIAKYLYGQTGVTSEGALIFFFAVVIISVLWSWRGQSVKTSVAHLPKGGKLTLRLLAFAAIGYVALGLPQVSGPFIAQVIVTVALFILMGLGLNITLGFAGLLDLGFVAFYAIGAYTVGLLTSYGPFGLQHISFWAAVPIAVLVAMAAGFVLGLPVLGVRGDYLAIATLGFGEIVRLLAGSDFLAKYFGGPQGVIGIQKPCLGVLEPFVKIDVPRVCNGIELGKPQDIYYVAVAAALLIAFVAWRLRESRLGRAWMAIREDEDVAEALGVNLIQTKLLAYMLGAAMAGLGGAIFATLIGSIFASSMQLIVSINVVSLIIVGGMGSIPGVIVGAIALIGLPELLREVSEFRYLLYGMTLIIMMLSKPEGLWPSQAAKRELHHVEASTEAEL
ncbi:MAG: branched-chain amino acid ABC transporter permease [Anaerolineaceae bacterium]|nr:MAG: branched-chain amino acid ABC transporter permease [Anaerolineaceae bacterium]